MYYVVKNNGIEAATEEEFFSCDDAVCILSQEEWERDESVGNHFKLHKDKAGVHFCKLEEQESYFYGTCHVPAKKQSEKDSCFSFYLLPEKIIFIDIEGVVSKQMKDLEKRQHLDYTLERFFVDFLTGFIENDLFFLQGLEKQIMGIEEDVLKNGGQDFNLHMLKLKKKIAKFFRYYSQLIAFGEKLLENEMDFFGKNDLKMLDRFTDRVQRLSGETQTLREYAMQVQEVYQAEIGIKQNEVMRTLTVVTAIFLPLTLIAGWYGMNFVNMPELTSPYGYSGIIIASILIVVVCLYIFKKKKFW